MKVVPIKPLAILLYFSKIPLNLMGLKILKQQGFYIIKNDLSDHIENNLW